MLRRNGYFNVKSTLEVSVKVNAVQVPCGFYDDTEGWHITSGYSGTGLLHGNEPFR